MSTVLAIGGVSAVLRNILDNGVIDAAQALGTPVKVTAIAPDLVKTDDPNAPPQLNLFLYRVTPNQGWRNANLPGYDDDGTRIANPPLALNLHYLVTAYAQADLHAEILLGYAMHLLHERPWLDRATIRKSLSLSPLPSSILPDAFRDPADAGLADQTEGLKITLSSLDSEELSRLWSAMQTHYRPSAAYQVSVVLIEAHQPVSAPLPVLSRGPVDPVSKRDTGVAVTAGLEPPYPTVHQVLPSNGQPAARLGEQVVLRGHHLDGSQIRVRFAHPLLAQPHEVDVPDNADPHELTVPLPGDAPARQDWPAGVWAVSVSLRPPGDPVSRRGPVAPMLLAPVPGLPPASVQRAGDGSVRVDLAVSPRVRSGQPVQLCLGTVEVPGVLPADPADPIRFVFPSLTAGVHRVRVRVDGVESILVDRSTQPPTFVPGQTVTVPS
jgi:hypothetical protein